MCLQNVEHLPHIPQKLSCFFFESAKDFCDFSSEPPRCPETEARVDIFRPDHNKYYASAFTEVRNGGKHDIIYEDEDKEVFNIFEKSWRFKQSPLHAAAISIRDTLQSNEQSFIRSMMDQLGQQPFLWLHAEGFE